MSAMVPAWPSVGENLMKSRSAKSIKRLLVLFRTWERNGTLEPEQAKTARDAALELCRGKRGGEHRRTAAVERLVRTFLKVDPRG